MAVRDVVKKILKARIGLQLPARLYPVFYQAPAETVAAGLPFLTLPPIPIYPTLLVEIADAGGCDYYRIAAANLSPMNVMVIILDRPTVRDYSAATLTIAAGQLPVQTDPDRIVLEVIEHADGGRGIHSVHIDDFAVLFGAHIPASLALGARPIVHQKLVNADVEPDEKGKLCNRGYQRFVDQWKNDGLIG